MNMIKESDLKILFTESQIKNSIEQLGNKLNNEYNNEELYCYHRYNSPVQ